MPQRNKIKYTPVAVDDMDEIFSYISQDNVIAAEALLDRINYGITKLSEFPNIGSVLSEDEYTLVNPGYREYSGSYYTASPVAGNRDSG